MSYEDRKNLKRLELLNKSKELKNEHNREWQRKGQELRKDTRYQHQHAVRTDMIRECLNYINKYDGVNTWKLVKNKINGYYKIVEYSGSELIKTEFASRDLSAILAYVSSTRNFLSTRLENT